MCVDSAEIHPQAQWQHAAQTSARLAENIQEFGAAADNPGAEPKGFKLADEQRALCKDFGAALEVAVDEEIKWVPINK